MCCFKLLFKGLDFFRLLVLELLNLHLKLRHFSIFFSDQLIFFSAPHTLRRLTGYDVLLRSINVLLHFFQLIIQPINFGLKIGLYRVKLN